MILRCKVIIGSFPTCEICNNADALLRNRSKNLDDAQRLVVLAFKRLHLRQQTNERRHMELVKERCSKFTVAADGKRQPREAFIYSDAMTESTGSTPKVGRDRHSKPSKQIKNRLFTVQVICGDLNYYMNLSVDQLMPGGANLAIEIQRIAMERLSKDLSNLGLEMPPIVHWQFDNCGENKVYHIKYFYWSILNYVNTF